MSIFDRPLNVMNILIAPDSFKESLSAAEAAEAIARGVGRAIPDATVDLCPMADGGEGTVEALVRATGGEFFATEVTGPLGEPVDAIWGELGKTPLPQVEQRLGEGDDSADTPSPQPSPSKGEGGIAVIEMASAAGLEITPPDQRDPTQTTTFGVGQLIHIALDYGNTTVIIGLGGSATTDGGAGCAQALGTRFVDNHHETIEQPMTGGLLETVNEVDLSTVDSRALQARLRVACDVTNPLFGPEGAAHVYAPQKGATPEQVEQLDAGLLHLAKTTFNAEPDRPGMGAAGGLAFGLTHYLGAQLERGIELVMEAVGFDERCRRADLVITGEGKLDGQSIQGKTCMGVAQRAATLGVKTIALVGHAADDADLALRHGLSAYHAMTGMGIDSADAIANAAQHLEELAFRVCQEITR